MKSFNMPEFPYAPPYGLNYPPFMNYSMNLEQVPQSPDSGHVPSPYYESAPNSMMQQPMMPPPPGLLPIPMNYPALLPSPHTRPPMHHYTQAPQQIPRIPVLPTAARLPPKSESIHLSRNRVTKADKAWSEVGTEINARVQRIIEMLTANMPDDVFESILFRKCLKCKRGAVNEGNRAANKHTLAAFFCASCVMDLCDICWRFVKEEVRTTQQYEDHFKRECGRHACCIDCLRRCWICARHVKPPSGYGKVRNVTVEERIFNMCKDRVTVDEATRLSREVYTTSAERAYRVRKNTLDLFEKLSVSCWGRHLPCSAKNHQFALCDATWRSVRCQTMLPAWMSLLKKTEKKINDLSVISDGRALNVYRQCMGKNLLPRMRNKADGSVSVLGMFPRIQSGSEARDLLSGKRIVVMGDSVGRHLYRDLINLLQGDGPLSTLPDHSFKGDDQYCNDVCLHGSHTDFRLYNVRNPDNKLTGKDWYEHRLFYGPNGITVEYLWVSRVWSDILRHDILSLFDPATYRGRSLQRTPDLVIFNSALWDLTRYGDRNCHEYKENCKYFADFWKDISLAFAQAGCATKSPVFINYTTPKPGAKVTGDLISDLSNEDRAQIDCDERVKRTRRFQYDAVKHALGQMDAARRVAFADLYDAAAVLGLETFRFADGIHYDPQAMRVFTAVILAEYQTVVNWHPPTTEASSSNKRAGDRDMTLNDALDDSVRCQWLYKCHDLVSAHTMSYYNAHTRPIDFALSEYRQWVAKNRGRPGNMEKILMLSFFPISTNGKSLVTSYPIDQLPRIMSRLHATMLAMLDDMGRLLLIHHAAATPPDAALLPVTVNVKWPQVVAQRRLDLRHAVSAIIERNMDRPNMVHYGPLNGCYANEFFVRICFVFQILKHTAYLVPLYRFVRDHTNDPSQYQRDLDAFNKGERILNPLLRAAFEHKIARAHVDKGVYIVKKQEWPIKSQLIPEDDYFRGYDLARLLATKAEIQVELRPALQALPSINNKNNTAGSSNRNSAVNNVTRASKPLPQRNFRKPIVVPKKSTAGARSTAAAAAAAADDDDEPKRARPHFGRAARVDAAGFVVEREEGAVEEESDDEDDLDDDQYIIEKVTDVRYHQDRTSDDNFEYLAVWKKYPGEDTWEPIQHLDDCAEIIDGFNSRPDIIAKKRKLVVDEERKVAREHERERQGQLKCAEQEKQRRRRRAALRAATIANCSDVKLDLENSKSDTSVDAAAPKSASAKASSKSSSAGLSSHKTIVKKSHENSDARSSSSKKHKKHGTKSKHDSDDDSKRRKKKSKKHSKERKEEKEERRRAKREKKRKEAEREKARLAEKELRKQQQRLERKKEQEKSATTSGKSPDNDEANSSCVANKDILLTAPLSAEAGTPKNTKDVSVDGLSVETSAQPIEYSITWRALSISSGVHAQLQLQSIICLLPQDCVDLPSSSSVSPREAACAVSDQPPLSEMASDVAIVDSSARDDAIANEEPQFQPLVAALVTWKGSNNIDVVEINFLETYYCEQLVAALIDYAV